MVAGFDSLELKRAIASVVRLPVAGPTAGLGVRSLGSLIAPTVALRLGIEGVDIWLDEGLR
jgi:hypothetical protein